MTDYSKLKNAELESLLKERSLPHNGKKAEMVARLTESDKPKKDTSSTTSSKPLPATAIAATPSTAKPTEEEDMVDIYDDGITPDPPSATTAPAAAALAAGGLSRIKNPTAVPNQISAIDPSKTNDLKVSKPSTGGPIAKPTSTSASAKPKPPTKATTAAAPNPPPSTNEADPEPKPPAQDFASGLAATSLATELAKRKTRAAKFGVPETTDPEAVKALERAKKFGTAPVAAANSGSDGAKIGMSKLDEALPERRERKRGRGREDEGAEDAGLKRRRGGGERRERGARSGERRRGRNGTTRTANGNGKGGEEKTTTTAAAAAWMSEADRRQADARKAKWAPVA